MSEQTTKLTKDQLPPGTKVVRKDDPDRHGEVVVDEFQLCDPDEVLVQFGAKGVRGFVRPPIPGVARQKVGWLRLVDVHVAVASQ